MNIILLSYRKSSLRIPVYLSDSIKIPELDSKMEKDSQIPHYSIEAANRKILIPESLAKQPDQLDTIIERMAQLTLDYEHDFEAAKKFTGDSEKLSHFKKDITIICVLWLFRICLLNMK